MDWEDRIQVDPSILVGKPVIRGTRLAVEFVVELQAEWSEADILRNYPQLAREDLQAALHYAAAALKREHVFPLPV
jgi:uncharacterized protein (DUF433 family)